MLIIQYSFTTKAVLWHQAVGCLLWPFSFRLTRRHGGLRLDVTLCRHLRLGPCRVARLLYGASSGPRDLLPPLTFVSNTVLSDSSVFHLGRSRSRCRGALVCKHVGL